MNFPLRWIILFLLCPLAAICSDSTAVSKSAGDIVLIFDNIPALRQKIHVFANFIHINRTPQVRIFDNFYLHNETPRPSVTDTIVYHPQGEYIVLSFLYSIMNAPIDYVISAGSTITFRFENGRPYATSPDPDIARYLNHEYNRLIANTTGLLYTPYEIYLNPATIAKSWNDVLDEVAFKKGHYTAAKSYLMNELQFLTEESGMAGKHPVLFNFFRDKRTYQVKRLDFEQNKLSPDSLRDFLLANKIKPTDNIPYSYFLPFLETVTRKKIIKEVHKLTSATGSSPDYREAYDRISAWNEINDFYKKQLLYRYLRLIGDGFPAADLNSYLSKFASFTNDRVLTEKIKQDYPQYELASLSGDSLYMLDTGNERLTLQDFLHQHKGRVIYIDFWASWCIPCRSEKDNAAELRKKFKDKDVVFAYFSIDKNKPKWIVACKEDKLNEIKHNYLLVNWNASAFLTSIDFGTIPRYLIYDKSGHLFHKKAQGPGSEETYRLLTQLISQ